MNDVLGLDLALSATGAARITDTGDVATWVHTTRPLPAGAALLDVDARLTGIADWVATLPTPGTVLAVVEGPSHGSQHGQPHERAALWWLVVRGLHRRGIPVAVCPPATAKKYLTGSGSAGKGRVQAAVADAWPGQGLDGVTSHEADAVAVATAGADWLGWPGPPLDGRRGSAVLSAVRWPERTLIPIERTR